MTEANRKRASHTAPLRKTDLRARRLEDAVRGRAPRVSPDGYPDSVDEALYDVTPEEILKIVPDRP